MIGVGFIFGPDLERLSVQFPNVKFAGIDYSPSEGVGTLPNLTGLRFREQEGSFLVGAIAGSITHTKIVGFVGGMQIPLIGKFEAGYIAGVKHVCPDCRVLSAYAGTEPKAFADPSLGQDLASRQYSKGADIIYHAAGKTGDGVFAAARQRGMRAIGVDSDQHDSAPCCIVTSMVKRVDVAVVDVIRDLANGKWTGGLRELGLAENGVGFVADERNQHLLPVEVVTKVNKLREDIISGAIKVPESSTAMIEAHVTKRYGVREVLHDASISLRAGSVHALVGENGAGKSTLVKIIAGVVHADGGAMSIDGKAVALAGWDRRRARAAGIGIVQQHGSFAHALSVVENAVLGVEGGPIVSLDGVAKKLRALGEQIGLPIDPYAAVERLGVGAQQRAEIVTALHLGATTLVLDEPTAVLAPVEVERLLATLRTLAADGKTIVIVTHKLDEVRSVADEVTVLREGATVATFDTKGPGGAYREVGLDVATIARAMVGDDVPSPMPLDPPPATAPTVLAVKSLGVGTALTDVTLDIRRGEIVGVAGVDGNGQRELALAIAGLAKSRGTVRIGDRDAAHDSPARRLAAGLAHVPEDRLHGGLVLEATVAENLALNRRDITGTFRINRDAVRKNAVKRISELDIRPADSDAVVRDLSGGNQQKVVVGRELSRPNLRVVVAAQPTRGVDLGAVAKIHDRLRAAAKSGAGVLVISADLDELLALCHRVVVLLRGRIVGSLAGDELRGDARQQLGLLMTGSKEVA